jgi:glutathione S-transferase
MMLRLLGRATSGNVQKVIFGLEEMQLPYEREDYGRQFGNTLTPDYAALNPTAKVPTLLDGDLVIWESGTILRYLATTSDSALYPSDPAARTHVERWMDWTISALNMAYLAGFRDAKKPAAEQAPDTAKNLAAELAILDGLLKDQAFVAGAAFSLADVALGPIVRRCVGFPFTLPAFPHIAAWLARLADRPAFQKAIAAG